MKKFTLLGGLLFIGLCTYLTSTPAGAAQDQNAVNSCVRRGIAYFKEIGSYPYLSSAPNKNRLAEDVALERCNRTISAF